MKLKKYMAAALLTWAVGSEGLGQTVIYSEDFGDGTSMPAGWTTSGEVNINGSNPSGGYSGASGGGNIILTDQSGGGGTIVVSGVINTEDYIDIQISWGAYETEGEGGFPDIELEWSSDSVGWNTIDYQDVISGSWQRVNSGAFIDLPTGAERKSNLYLRLSYTELFSLNEFYIDDFVVRGVFSPSDFYWDGVGPLNLTGSWVSSEDGSSGDNPSSFELPGTNFRIQNGNSATITSDWAVTGADSKVIVGNGIDSTEFVIPSDFIFSGVVDVNSLGILTLESTLPPTIGTIHPNGTVAYTANGEQNIIARTYQNLTIGGSGDKRLTGLTTVNGVCNLASGKLALNGQLLYVNGTLTGDAELKSGPGELSRLIFDGNGSGLIGALQADPDSNYFYLVRIVKPGLVQLASDIQANTLQLLSGEIEINDNELNISTFNGDQGQFVSSPASSLIIGNVHSTQNNLRFSAGSNAIGNLSLNSTNALNLRSDLTITNTLTLASGAFNINDNTLTLNGAPIQGTPANLTTTSSSSLIFGGSEAGVSIPSSVAALDNLTVENANGVSLSGDIAVSGNISVSGALEAGTHAFSGSGSANVTGSVLTEHASGISGTFGNTGGLTLDAGSTVVYNAAGDQTVSDVSYGALELSGSGIKTAAGDFTVAGDLTIGSGASFTAPSLLTLQGDFTPTGTFNHNNGTVLFAGSASQATGAGTTFYNLTLDNPGNSLSLAGENSLLNTLKLQAGTLNTNDQLTLVSDASGTGRIAKIEDGASLSGAVAMQRYLARSDAGFYYMGTPVKSQTLAEWMDDMWIQGVDTRYPDAYKNVAKFNEATRLWEPVTSASTVINPGEGVKVLLYASNFSSGSMTYDNIGAPVVGDGEDSANSGGNERFSFNVQYTDSGDTTGGWNLLANPFPSQIRWEQGAGWTSNNINPTLYVWDGDNYSYKSLQLDGTGDTSIINIASGQAFFIKAEGANPSLSVSEDAKTSQNSTFFRKKPLSDYLTVTVTDPVNRKDETYIRFRDEATEDYDPYYDGYKLEGSYLNLSSLASGGESLAINALPTVEQDTEVPLNLKTSQKGAFEMTIAGLSTFGPDAKIYLEDKFTDTLIQITDEATRYSFNITDQSASKGAERFRILLEVDDIEISGKISTVFGQPKPDVVVKAEGAHRSQSTVSGIDGKYLLNVSAKSASEITPGFDSDPNIDIFDILLTHLHGLGIKKLDDPYKVIAADVDGNETVDYADVKEMMSVIIRKQRRFTGSKSWAFVSEDQVFSDPNNPFPYQKSKSIPIGSGDVEANFIAAPLGKVNYTSGHDKTKTEELLLAAHKTAFHTDGSVSIPVAAKQLSDIITCNTLISWNSDLMKFRRVEPVEGWVDAHLTGENQLNLIWLDSQADGGNYDDVILFKLYFDVEERDDLGDISINFDAAPGPVSAIGADLTPYVVAQTDNKIKTDSQFTVGQNSPNPFDKQTQIPFGIPERGKVKLKIYNLLGEMVEDTEREFPAGNNIFEWINTKDLDKGVYIYKLEFRNMGTSAKMVITK